MLDKKKLISPGIFTITFRDLPSLQEGMDNHAYMKNLLEIFVDQTRDERRKTEPVYLEAMSFKDPPENTEAYQILQTLNRHDVLALRVATAMVRWRQHPQIYDWIPEHLRNSYHELAKYAVFNYPLNWPLIPSDMQTEKLAWDLLQTLSSKRLFTKLNDAWEGIVETFPDNISLHEIAARLGLFDRLAPRYQKDHRIFKAYVSGSEHNLHTFDFQRLDYDLAKLLLTNTRWPQCLDMVLTHVSFPMDTEQRKHLIGIGCQHLPSAYNYLSRRDREVFKTLPISEQTFGYYVKATAKDCCGALEGEIDPISLDTFDLSDNVYVHRWRSKHEKPNWTHRRCINENTLQKLMSLEQRQWLDPVSKESWSKSPPSSPEPQDTELSPCEVVLKAVRGDK
jgi:hypothetical protein